MEQVSAKISTAPTRLVCLPGGNNRMASPTRKAGKSQAIQPFQPEEPKTLSAIAPQDRFQIDLCRLEMHARRVNELAAELEQALWDLKSSATQVNQSSHTFREQFGHHWFPAQICEYHSVELPTLRQQENGQLVLASRTVDLFAAEREASELAAALRQRRRQRKAAPPTPAEPTAAAPAPPEAEKPKRRRKSPAKSSSKPKASAQKTSTEKKDASPRQTRRRKPASSGALNAPAKG